MEQRSNTFLDNASEALKNTGQAKRRDSMARLTPLLRSAAIEDAGDFESLRQQMKQVRQHSLDNLDHYLTQFEQEAVHNGNRVHFARDAEELNSIVLDICQQHDARRVVKGKSMVTEETGLNSFLQRAGLDVMETDLGEYIIQQSVEAISLPRRCINLRRKFASSSRTSTTWGQENLRTQQIWWRKHARC